MRLLPDSWDNVRCYTIKNNSKLNEDGALEREILREKLFSEDWVDAGNGIIVNFSENKS